MNFREADICWGCVINIVIYVTTTKILVGRTKFFPKGAWPLEYT